MSTSYRPYEPDQVMLLPAAPQDWLPQGHLAYFINDTVDALNLKAFYAKYEGGGSRNQPFHPAMMVKVLVYAYATGVFSSRKIERRLHEDLACPRRSAGECRRRAGRRVRAQLRRTTRRVERVWRHRQATRSSTTAPAQG